MEMFEIRGGGGVFSNEGEGSVDCSLCRLALAFTVSVKLHTRQALQDLRNIV